jgi:hypothetical protein
VPSKLTSSMLKVCTPTGTALKVKVLSVDKILCPAWKGVALVVAMEVLAAAALADGEADAVAEVKAVAAGAVTIAVAAGEAETAGVIDAIEVAVAEDVAAAVADGKSIEYLSRP